MIKTKYPTTKPSLNLDFANTKSLDPRITFRRGTPGTYYDGVTHVKAEENLVYPSIPDSNWTAYEYSITTNSVTAPDGTTTASKIVLNSGITGAYNIEKLINVSINNFYTFSIYAKAGEFSVFNFDTQDSYFAQVNVVVDLSTGSIIEKGVDVIDSSITDIGNGWYRIVMTGVAIATGSSKFIIRNFEDTGDGSSGFYLWGAQLEQRDAVTSYTETTGAPITKYQPKLMTASPDDARFDHDPLTGESKGLLIEESRTNLLSYSEDFDNGYWDHPRASVYTNSIAPDGTSSASELVANVSAAGGMSIYRYSAITISSPFTVSCYFKKGDNDYAAMYTTNGAGSGVNQYFDILNGTVQANTSYGSVSFTINDASIQDVGNGWFRCSVTITTDATSARTNFSPSVPTGDGSDVSCTIYETRGFLWGAQLEAGSFPTSYIKTTGASATRSADNASITGENFSSWYRQDEGTLYSEVNTLADSSASRISMSDGTSSNRIFISNGIYPLYVRKDDSIQVREESSAIVNAYSKRAAGLKKDDFAISIDGGDPLIDTAGDLPFVDRFAFSTSHVSDNYVNGHIKKLAYYPQRLTNEQLQNLTK